MPTVKQKNAMTDANLARVPHECAIQLQAVYETLKTAEHKAADFILERSGEISGLSIVDFADRAGCSEATVVRLSKKLGYEGYPELKAAFDGGSLNNDPVEYENIVPDDDPLTVLHKVVESSVTALQDTEKVMDRTAYERALDAMLAAERIMFCGVGDAGVVAAEAYQRWVRMGQPCLHASDHDMQLILASKLKPADVLFAISHSGRTKTVLNVVRTAEKQGAVVIALTNFPISPLAKRASLTLQTAVFSRFATGEVMSKRLAELCVIESLSISFLMRKGEAYYRSLADSNNSVSINKL
jgi:RpiR family transcriptional regulator, carbohydrate utilization regulator